MVFRRKISYRQRAPTDSFLLSPGTIHSVGHSIDPDSNSIALPRESKCWSVHEKLHQIVFNLRRSPDTLLPTLQLDPVRFRIFSHSEFNSDSPQYGDVIPAKRYVQEIAKQENQFSRGIQPRIPWLGAGVRGVRH